MASSPRVGFNPATAIRAWYPCYEMHRNDTELLELIKADVKRVKEKLTNMIDATETD